MWSTLDRVCPTHRGLLIVTGWGTEIFILDVTTFEQRWQELLLVKVDYEKGSHVWWHWWTRKWLMDVDWNIGLVLHLWCYVGSRSVDSFFLEDSWGWNIFSWCVKKSTITSFCYNQMKISMCTIYICIYNVYIILTS